LCDKPHTPLCRDRDEKRLAGRKKPKRIDRHGECNSCRVASPRVSIVALLREELIGEVAR